MTNRTATTERSICVALPASAEEGAVPEWVMLIPAAVDGVVPGRDGRVWRMGNPQAVVDASLKDGVDLPFDWEHASEVRAPNGARERAPAAGWIKELQVRDGAIWSRVAWTKPGAKDLAAKHYRYVSSAFDYHTGTREIVRLSSAGLVHSPNLEVPALNNQQQMEGPAVTIPNSVLLALGLGEGAGEAQCLTAINSLKGDVAKAQNRAESPPLEKFVPRADHDAAVERATNAERRLQELEAAGHQEKVDVAIKGALSAGKISPATEAYHRAACSTSDGLKAFIDYVKAAPVVVGDSGISASPKPGDGLLSEEEKAICRQLGLEEADYAKSAGGAA